MVRRPTKLADTLRELIAKSDESRNAIAEATGIDRGNLSRFMNGKGGLSIEAIDALMDYFGLELKHKATRRRKGR